MEIKREADGAALLELDHGEVLDLLGAIALSMTAYSILQNFMTPAQKTLTLPSLRLLVELGASLGQGEDFGPPAAETAPVADPA